MVSDTGPLSPDSIVTLFGFGGGIKIGCVIRWVRKQSESDGAQRSAARSVSDNYFRGG